MTIPPFPTDLSPGDISLRDHFAAKAMAAIMSTPDRCEEVRDWFGHLDDDTIAKAAYQQADAMLAERAKASDKNAEHG